MPAGLASFVAIGLSVWAGAMFNTGAELGVLLPGPEPLTPETTSTFTLAVPTVTLFVTGEARPPPLKVTS